jgi:hypothetical protein
LGTGASPPTHARYKPRCAANPGPAHRSAAHALCRQPCSLLLLRGTRASLAAALAPARLRAQPEPLPPPHSARAGCGRCWARPRGTPAPYTTHTTTHTITRTAVLVSKLPLQPPNRPAAASGTAAGPATLHALPPHQNNSKQPLPTINAQLLPNAEAACAAQCRLPLCVCAHRSCLNTSHQYLQANDPLSPKNTALWARALTLLPPPAASKSLRLMATNEIPEHMPSPPRSGGGRLPHAAGPVMRRACHTAAALFPPAANAAPPLPAALAGCPLSLTGAAATPHNSPTNEHTPVALFRRRPAVQGCKQRWRPPCSWLAPRRGPPPPSGPRRLRQPADCASQPAICGLGRDLHVRLPTPCRPQNLWGPPSPPR